MSTEKQKDLSPPVTRLKEIEVDDQAAKKAWHKAQQLPQPYPTAEDLQPVWDAQAESAKLEKLEALNKQHPELGLGEKVSALKAAAVEKKPTIHSKEATGKKQAAPSFVPIPPLANPTAPAAKTTPPKTH